MKFGKLNFASAHDNLALMAPVVASAAQNIKDIYVAEIDASLADTAAFCQE